jgi:putative ABC transport system permease protein
MKDIEIAIRNLKRNKINTAIITISLSLGFACLNLITTFLARELRTDNFHTDKNRIFSITSDDAFHSGNISYTFNDEAEEYIKTNFEQVEDVCTYTGFMTSNILVDKNNISDLFFIVASSPNFFDFFTYPLLVGNPKSVLESSNSIVISDKLAQKFFSHESPIGKTIEFKIYSTNYSFEIAGIFKKTNQNSQLNFDMVVKIQPTGFRKGYLKLANSSNAADVESLLKKYKSEIPITSGETQGQYYLQSMKDTYFDESRSHIGVVENSESKSTIWIVACVGILIMALAMFNYLGIVNYNLLERSKNFSIYQLNGANKIQLVKTVLSEVFLLFTTSFLTSLVLLKWILPVFNHLINTSISYVYTFQLTNLVILLLVLLFAFVIVSFFVIYKLNSITGYSALNGIKTNLKFQLPALNVFQLAVTILLIISSLIIVKQIHFINLHNIGIDKEVFDLSVPRDMSNKLGILKNKLNQFPSIESASIAESSVFGFTMLLFHYYENGEERSFSPTIITADEDYIKTLGIKITLGQNFTSDPIENRYTCLINESMAKYLNRNEIIGSKLPVMEHITIVGVVEDFNYQNLRSFVSPAFIQWEGVNYHLLDIASNIFIKTTDNKSEQALDDIKKVWKEVLPEVPFEYTTIGLQYQRLHAENNKTIQLVMLGCVTSILLSMMGLFAGVLQNSKFRTKEIGIRKVNGARISEVLIMLNKDFVKWVAIAFVIATPIAYYAMHKWLQNFAYKTELSWWIFALAGLLALGIALLTVSWQSWRAAVRNPVEALRYE